MNWWTVIDNQIRNGRQNYLFEFHLRDKIRFGCLLWTNRRIAYFDQSLWHSMKINKWVGWKRCFNCLLKAKCKLKCYTHWVLDKYMTQSQQTVVVLFNGMLHSVTVCYSTHCACGDGCYITCTFTKCFWCIGLFLDCASI